MIALLPAADGHDHGVATGLDSSVVALLVAVAVLAILALRAVVRHPWP